MQYINNFIRFNQLRQADAIVVKKDFFGILDHYVIFLGISNGEPKFIANYTDGIKVISKSKIAQFLESYSPVRINRFKGTEPQRVEAVNRALSRKDENSYNLILNNCEHYFNFVHHGIEISEQVKNLGGVATIGGVTIAAISAAKGNKTGTNIGLAITGLGLLTLLADALNKNDK